jgi:hypothetical protein
MMHEQQLRIDESFPEYEDYAPSHFNKIQASDENEMQSL